MFSSSVLCLVFLWSFVLGALCTFSPFGASTWSVLFVTMDVDIVVVVVCIHFAVSVSPCLCGCLSGASPFVLVCMSRVS